MDAGVFLCVLTIALLLTDDGVPAAVVDELPVVRLFGEPSVAVAAGTVGPTDCERATI